MKERCRNPWPKHDHCHDSIDQILDLGHAPFATFQRLLNVAVALIADCNVDGQVFLSIRHWFQVELLPQKFVPELLFAQHQSIGTLLGMGVFQGKP